MQATVQHERPKHLLTADGRFSGCVIEDGILYRRARASKHLLRKPPAWAFEECILREAEQAGVHTVRVEDMDTLTVYVAPLRSFWTRGIAIERGFALQRALPLWCWHAEKIDPTGQLVLFPVSADAK